jgi:flagellar motor switch protein FliN
MESSKPEDGATTSSELWPQLKHLSCLITLELPVPQFTVRQMLALSSGQVVDTQWSQAADLPLRMNGALLAWSEFEVVDNRYGVRITELT